jgi:hypothetical protein
MANGFTFPDEAKADDADQSEFELDLETDEEAEGKPQIEVVDDTPPQDRGRKPLDKEIEEPSEEELNEYSSKVQKRLKELTHARHDERRKADALARQMAELERAAKAMAVENQRLQEFVNVGQTAYIDKSKSLAEVAISNARAKLKAAMDAGDTDAAVDAQEEMYKAQFEMQQVNSFKPVQLRKPIDSGYTEQKQAPQPQLDEMVVSWAEQNQWFEKPGNEDMTGFAYGVHNKLVREFGEGYTKSSEYYQKIDNAMRKAFPDRFDDIEVGTEEAPKASRPKTVVASAQRTSAPKKIRLTKTQQNVAKRLGIPLELYAKKMVELENQNG